MRKLFAAVVVIAAFASGVAYAGAEGGPYPARIRCAHMSEDSAAHLKLVEYTPKRDGSLRLVYRCKRGF